MTAALKASPKVDLLHVSLDIGKGQGPIKIGRLAWSAARRLSVFEYDTAFVAQGVELSPFRLKLSSNAQTARYDPFEGLFGLFADSLPDGWGRRLTDRRLQSQGINPTTLTPVDRLSLIGRTGMGALTYEPDASSPLAGTQDLVLDTLYADAALFDRGEDATDLVRLERLNGGSTGARPKAMIHIAPDGSLWAAPALDREAWIVKFASLSDGPDVGAMEAAYAVMARQAGLRMPETRFFPADAPDRKTASNGYFGTKRFDRVGIRRNHVHTAAGALHADYRTPSLTYEDLLTLTRLMTRDQDEVDEQFRRAAFNVLAGNRDDHAKNHAFVLDADQLSYRLTPAYDITQSDGMGGEHALAVNGRGKAIGPDDLKALARHGGLPPARAQRIIEEVIDAIQDWFAIADTLPIARAQRLRTGALLDALLRPFGASTRRAPSRKDDPEPPQRGPEARRSR